MTKSITAPGGGGGGGGLRYYMPTRAGSLDKVQVYLALLSDFVWSGTPN